MLTSIPPAAFYVHKNFHGCIVCANHFKAAFQAKWFHACSAYFTNISIAHKRFSMDEFHANQSFIGFLASISRLQIVPWLHFLLKYISTLHLMLTYHARLHFMLTNIAMASF